MEYSPETILGVPVPSPAPDAARVVDTVVDLTDPVPARRPPGPNGSAAADHRRVAELVENGTAVGNAITRAAEDTGKARNTIQNNYYRTVRKLRAQASAESGPAEPAAGDGVTTLGALPDDVIDGIVSEVVKGVKLLAAAAEARAAEIAQLRAKLEAVRRATE